MDLPVEVRERLARALGVFIRDVAAGELPRELKRWRSFRPQTIAARSQELVPALEDSKLRARVLEWLDDKPPLKASEAEVLRTAVERSDDWERKLSSMSPARPQRKRVSSADKDLRARAERDRLRARELREELRNVREEGRRELQRERKRSADALRLAAALERKLEARTVAPEKARAEAVASAQAAERERRRAKSAAEKARADRDEIRAQLREARRDNRELARRVRDLEARPARRSERTQPARAPVTRRRILKAPAGLLADSPEALRHWLGAKARLLVDGYNVTKAEGGYGRLSLADQRERLLEELGRLARRYSVGVLVVFDGSEVVPGTARRSRRGVRVEYSKPPETADDHLVALLKKLPPEPVVVVTNDRELQDRARAEAATVATSDQLLALLR